jgi:hypothetical protein
MSSNINDEIMNNNFPLFELLYEKTDKKGEMSMSDMSELVNNLRALLSNINNVQNVQSILFVLIRIYSLRFNDKDNIFDVPFSGEKLNNKGDDKVNDIKFDLRNFPSRLQYILLEYTRLEMNKNNN